MTDPIKALGALDEWIHDPKRFMVPMGQLTEAEEALGECADTIRAALTAASQTQGKPALGPACAWVQCPVCREPDMRFSPDKDEPDKGYIHCVNLGCASNDPAARPTPPEGMVLVPIEPTEAMIKEAVMAHMSTVFGAVVDQQKNGMISQISFTCVPEWKAMIAAAQKDGVK